MVMARTIFVVLVYFLFAFGVLAVMFVLQGLGLWRMAKNAGISHAWVAFLPLGNGYILGLLADRSRYTYTGKAPRLGLAFWLPIAQALAVVSMMGVFGLALGRYPFNFMVVLFVGTFFLGSALSVGLNLFCVYYIFKDYAPENAVLYTIVGILFNIYWVFLLVEMNTVPVSVAGPGPFPYGRPKYGRQQQPWPQQGPAPGQPPQYQQYQNQADYRQSQDQNQGPEL